MTDGHSTALGSAPSSRHFLWGPPRLGGSPGPAARARACCARWAGTVPPRVGRRGCAQPLHHLAGVQVERRRCLPVSDAGGARRGRPRCYFCYCSSFYHSVLRVSPSPSWRSPLVTQSPDVRAHLRLPTCPGVTLFSSLSVFGFGGTERRKSAPLCYQRLCNRGGRTSFLGATGTLTDPAAELREASREGDLG